jgi:predicted Zn-dependent peptidase
MEDTRNVSGWLGGQEMLVGEIKTPDEIIALVDAVTMDDIRRVAREILVGPKLSVAIVGPFKSDKRFAKLAQL